MFLPGVQYRNKTQPGLVFLCSTAEVRLEGVRVHGTWAEEFTGELIANDCFTVGEGDMHEWTRSAEQPHYH
jgi:hypothetical protein